MAVAACSGGREAHFMTDQAYRAQVEQDFNARMTANGGALAQFAAIPADATLPEQEALQFLYAYMPLADVTDYPTQYYLDQVRASFRTREEMAWKVPEREFRHFVLPIRVNNENLDTSRVAFGRELKPRVQGMSMAEAIEAPVDKMRSIFGIKSTTQVSCKCPSCGATLTGIKGETEKCPYCGTFHTF